MMKKMMRSGAILLAVVTMTVAGSPAVFANSSDKTASIQESNGGTKAFMPLWKAQEDVRAILDTDAMTPQEKYDAIKLINDQYCEYTGGGQLDDIDLILDMFAPMTYQTAADKIRTIMESDGMTKQEQYNAIKKISDEFSANNNGAMMDDIDLILDMFTPMTYQKATDKIRTIMESDGMTKQEQYNAIKKISDEFSADNNGEMLDDIDLILDMFTPMTYQKATDKIRTIMESDGMTKQEQYNAIKKIGDEFSADNNGAILDDYPELLALYAE